MRLLANENIPGAAVTELLARGHDVAWVRTTAPGMADTDVLAWAVRERRVLLTFDKDLGELAWNAPLPADSGVVLFRIPIPRAAEVGAQLAALVALREDWEGRFSVVEMGRVRMRRLPTTPQL